MLFIYVIPFSQIDKEIHEIKYFTQDKKFK